MSVAETTHSSVPPAELDTAPPAAHADKRPSKLPSPYPLWFYLPAVTILVVFFLLPTLISFFFAFTRWDLTTWEFTGLDNFRQFFREPQLTTSLVNTLVFGFVTSGSKVVLALLVAVFLSSRVFGRTFLRATIFFPVLLSTIGVGIAFEALLNPYEGIVNEVLALFRITGPGWFSDPSTALLTVAAIDVWKGLGVATVIYIAGLASIPDEYVEAAAVDGAGPVRIFFDIKLPLLWPSTMAVILLSLIGGLRSFDLIWATTGGGPGFASDVLTSVIYKQYSAGFFGLSTAGNLLLFLLVLAIIIPMRIAMARTSRALQ